MRGVEPGRFWDERARENALFFVDNTLDYGNPDEEAFWDRGGEALDRILGALGVDIGAGDTVVDIGCGVGRMTRALAKRAAHVVGIDVSKEMLVRAREYNAHLSNVEWVHGDGRTLEPLGDGSVDGCFSHVVFQHIPDAEVTLGYVREMARVLRPGGWAAFVLSTTPDLHQVSPAARARSALHTLIGRGPRWQSDPAWLGSWVELDALRDTARRSHLAVEKVVNPRAQFTGVLCRREH